MVGLASQAEVEAIGDHVSLIVGVVGGGMVGEMPALFRGSFVAVGGTAEVEELAPNELACTVGESTVEPQLDTSQLV